MKRCKKQLETDLPECVISYIFSKLGLKDLVKTSVLSKRWLREWGLRMDLNFDLQNMFGHNTIQELQENLPLFQSEFATRLDQFIQHYHGVTIRSIKLKFPLGDDHSYAIDRLISQGIAKGVNRIELLFSYDTNYTDLQMEPYKFSFTLLSNTHSLAHLHLQNCRIVAPLDFSGFKNLRTLVLHVVGVTQDILQGLFSNCIHLADFTLDDCEFNSDLKIISPTLFHLNIVNCWVDYWPKNIDIIASNLTSIEYSCNGSDVHLMNIKARMLSKFSFRGCEIPEHFDFSGLRNATTIMLDGISLSCIQIHVLPLLFSECLQLEDVTFKNCKIVSDLIIISPKLRHLKIIDCGMGDHYPWRVIIDALNLSSFEYSCNTGKHFYVIAPRLSKVFWNAAKLEKNPCPFGPIARLQHIEILAMILNFSQIAELTRILVQFQNLRQLELFIEGAYDPNMNYFWILDIAMASQHLHKLSITITNSHMENSHMVGFQRQREYTEYTGFFHNDLKYVELRGCVCTINVIELAGHFLRNASLLKQITFSSRYKFYIGGERWTTGRESCCWPEHNLIYEMLKDELNEECRLIIL